MFFLGAGCGVGLALIALPSRRPKAPAGQHDRPRWPDWNGVR
jgi:hypothetical protein